MRKLYSATLVILGLAAVIVCEAQEPVDSRIEKSKQQPRKIVKLVPQALIQFQPDQTLIQFEPEMKDPFVLNQPAAEELAKLNDAAAEKQARHNEKLATAQFQKVKAQLADLIIKHPQTSAGKEAQELLDKAGLRVIPNYGIYPKDTFFSVVPYTR